MGNGWHCMGKSCGGYEFGCECQCCFCDAVEEGEDPKRPYTSWKGEECWCEYCCEARKNMKTEGYFVLSSGEDGISISGPLDAPTLKKRLVEEHWGRRSHAFHESVPDTDKGCFCGREEKLLIIKGAIVVPQPKQVVTEFELP